MVAPDDGAAARAHVIMTSVVVPVYRNRDTLAELHRRIAAALRRLDGESEIIFVNDACPDGSLDTLREIATIDRGVIVVAHEARRGQHQALLTGLRRSRGDVLVTLDADLQDAPEVIPSLVARLAGGFDAVFAGRRGQYESRGRLATSWLFKRTISAITGMPADAGSFVAMTRRLVDRLLGDAGPHPYFTAAVACTGLPMTSIPVVRGARHRGESAYSASMRLRLGTRAIVQALRWRLRARDAGD
jgi:glycosyltransferase involved in cell wall biosynthesis